MPRTPARVRLVRFERASSARDLRTDVAEVEVVQYDRLQHPLPGQPGGLLRADDAAAEPGLLERDQPRHSRPTSIRDLTAPRDFHGSEGVTSVGAVERLREGKVITTPLGLTTEDN